MANVPKATEHRILNESNRILTREKIGDFINDPRQFFHRQRVGYYDDRLVQIHRWLVNDEQQQINDYFGRGYKLSQGTHTKR